ncbi:hypothetical protein Trad_1246 [Truepera radiovictrix DSM 17093]|uniref:Uncharacterized protein n=1 Tax=Truepera radiovictrix (strain DSM 17093 / CIP 108686 / LMG 22925 / RQ-24) TaxID=649638 RepID=D7CWH0_TRURR|nr:hypothetical protein Trad_1246 [Truepera radiovictrix DSM 17093]
MRLVNTFLRSLEADPEEQRVSKAAIHLRSLVFGRLSDDHAVALALLHELRGLYRRAYGTEQVLRDHHATQETALLAHLRQLGLPCCPDELGPEERAALLGRWQRSWSELPRPFDALMERFLSDLTAPLAPSA